MTTKPSSRHLIRATVGQELVWLAYKLEARMSDYLAILVLTVRGKISPEEIVAHSAEIAASQPALRSIYDESEVGLSIHLSDVPLVIDLCPVGPGVDPVMHARMIATENIAIGAPGAALARCVVLAEPANVTHIVWLCHHLVIDASSLSIIFRCYIERLINAAVPLRVSPAEYIDYCGLIRRRQERPPFREGRWWDECRSLPPDLRLATTDAPDSGGCVLATIRNSGSGQPHEAAGSRFSQWVYAVNRLQESWLNRVCVVLAGASVREQGDPPIVGCFFNSVPVITELPNSGDREAQLAASQAAVHRAMKRKLVPYHRLVASARQSKFPVASLGRFMLTYAKRELLPRHGNGLTIVPRAAYAGLTSPAPFLLRVGYEDHLLRLMLCYRKEVGGEHAKVGVQRLCEQFPATGETAPILEHVRDPRSPPDREVSQLTVPTTTPPGIE